MPDEGLVFCLLCMISILVGCIGGGSIKNRSREIAVYRLATYPSSLSSSYLFPCLSYPVSLSLAVFPQISYLISYQVGPSIVLINVPFLAPHISLYHQYLPRFWVLPAALT